MMSVEEFDEVKREAKQEGQVALLRALVENRLGRSLDDAEVRALSRRLDTLGVEAVSGALFSNTPTELASWIAGGSPAAE